MTICEKGHKAVVFTDASCPACSALAETEYYKRMFFLATKGENDADSSETKLQKDRYEVQYANTLVHKTEGRPGHSANG